MISNWILAIWVHLVVLANHKNTYLNDLDLVMGSIGASSEVGMPGGIEPYFFLSTCRIC